MNLWEIIANSAYENEIEGGTPSSTSKPTVAQYARWAKTAQGLIASNALCIEDLVTFSSVANQEKYSTDARFIRPIYTEWAETYTSKYELKNVPINKMRNMMSFNTSTGTPTHISIFNRDLYIHPTRASASASTTLSAAMAKGATTATVTSNSGFNTQGRALITDSSAGNEVISWTGLSGTTGLTGVTRGLEGTVDVAHSGTEAIAERDIFVWSAVRYITRMPEVWNTGTCTVTNGDATVSAGSGTLWTTAPHAYAGQKFGVGTNPSKWYTISSITNAGELELTENYAESTGTTQSYVIASELDIPDEYFDIVSLYLTHKTKQLYQFIGEAKAASDQFWGRLRDMRNQYTDRSDQAYPTMVDSDMMLE